MNIENITSDGVTLNSTGKSMQIKVYEDLLMKKDEELDQYKNNWEELKKWLNEEYDFYDKYGNAPTGYAMGETKRTLNKMKELEDGK